MRRLLIYHHSLMMDGIQVVIILIIEYGIGIHIIDMVTPPKPDLALFLQIQKIEGVVWLAFLYG